MIAKPFAFPPASLLDSSTGSSATLDATEHEGIGMLQDAPDKPPLSRVSRADRLALRQRLQQAFSDAGDLTSARRLALCGAEVFFEVAGSELVAVDEEGEVVVQTLPCKTALCPTCTGLIPYRTRAHLTERLAGVAADDCKTFILTQPAISGEGLVARVERLLDGWAKLRRSRHFRRAFVGGCLAIEVAFDRGHPHVHGQGIAELGRHSAVMAAANAWSRSTGGRLHMQTVRSPAGIIRYVTKQFLYAPHFTATDEDLAGLVALVHRSFRWMRSFGAWHGNGTDEEQAGSDTELTTSSSTDVPPLAVGGSRIVDRDRPLDAVLRAMFASAPSVQGRTYVDPETGEVLAREQLVCRLKQAPTS